MKTEGGAHDSIRPDGPALPGGGYVLSGAPLSRTGEEYDGQGTETAGTQGTA